MVFVVSNFEIFGVEVRFPRPIIGGKLSGALGTTFVRPCMIAGSRVLIYYVSIDFGIEKIAGRDVVI